MDKKLLVAGAIFGMLGVGIGAFAAHGLKPLISESAILTFETGVKYQMYHALLLLLIGGYGKKFKYKNLVFWCLILGIVFFSGSIYFLATNNLTIFNFKSIGFITPIGGSLLIAAWLLLMLNFLKLKKK